MLKHTDLLYCKGHALQTWESMLGSMNFALKQYVICELLLKISIPCLLGFVFFPLSPFTTSSNQPVHFCCVLLPFQLLHNFYWAHRELGPLHKLLPRNITVCRTQAVAEHCQCSGGACKYVNTCCSMPAAPS